MWRIVRVKINWLSALFGALAVLVWVQRVEIVHLKLAIWQMTGPEEATADELFGEEG